jgi:hypothetical protein
MSTTSVTEAGVEKIRSLAWKKLSIRLSNQDITDLMAEYSLLRSAGNGQHGRGKRAWHLKDVNEMLRHYAASIVDEAKSMSSTSSLSKPHPQKLLTKLFTTTGSSEEILEALFIQLQDGKRYSIMLKEV